jgi:DNA polymerase lambda
VQGLAKAIFDKIRQLIETGHISKLENFSRRGEISACQQL